MIITEADGNTFSGSVTTSISSEAQGSKCIVCHSVEGNEACNASGLSCEARPDQVCQTLVRASNGLPPRFEKRCKQKIACENERAMYKSRGECGSRYVPYMKQNFLGYKWNHFLCRCFYSYFGSFWLVGWVLKFEKFVCVVYFATTNRNAPM